MAVIKLEQVQSSRRQKLGGLANELYQSKLRNNPPVLPNRVVTIDKINTNSIQISWEKATDKETAQNELKYKVQWVMGPSYSNNESKETVYMTNVNSYKITGLYPNTVTESRSLLMMDSELLCITLYMSPPCRMR